jgi:hypothetical protein
MSQVSDGHLTPRRTGRLTVGRNLTLALTLTYLTVFIVIVTFDGI